jgi:DNA adenine methylase
MTAISTPKLMAYSYFGGKNALLDWLLPLLTCVQPNHFVDACTGSGCVGLNMDCPIVTINDINSQVVNFFECLRNHPDQLLTALHLTPYSQFEYLNAWVDEAETTLPPVERARKFYIRVMQSFGSTGIQKKYNSWAYSTRSVRSKISSEVANWLKCVDGLYSIVDRLKDIQVENKHYSAIISTYGHDKNTLIYFDPPYPKQSRTGNISYAYDFTEADHRHMSGERKQCRAMVAVSGYRCQLMDELYAGFYITHNKLTRTNIGHRQEALWTSYDPALYLPQQKLF